MIQRIQTVYLFLASLAIYGLFIFPVVQTLTVDGAKQIKITGVYETVSNQVVQTEPFILLTIATALLGLVPLLLIFQYKKRKQQATLIYIFVVIMIAFSFWIAQTVKVAANTNLEISNYNIGAGLTSVAILFLVLAGKGVIRDEKLVKSADRLR
ncbi:hypothetical protein A5893_01730 [Pedobacter psychrophilus]|uniref:DUF4293 domain-containing protein n=1 Tax=Pedobacter psychrophilus TaxID=1826909 RepID=A0A179DMZ4_9SPHI|nr:DUF4293 domain-containing protein [Pedobacter psychrophilus]OAQ41863.1 hypothetical protein A5893_01730 [Pedobacter psychrophilus]